MHFRDLLCTMARGFLLRSQGLACNLSRSNTVMEIPYYPYSSYNVKLARRLDIREGGRTLSAGVNFVGRLQLLKIPEFDSELFLCSDNILI